jgi:transcription initiation factor TFIIB
MTEEPTKNNPAKIDKCPECESTNLVNDYDTGEKICGDCGLVLYDQMIDKGPEKPVFTLEEFGKRIRYGAPQTLTMHDKGLSTSIDWHDQDSHGKKLNSEQKGQAWRLRKWHRRTRVRDSGERTLALGLADITKTADNLNIPQNSSIRETASVILRKAAEKKLIRGRSIQGLAAASVELACRQCVVPRSHTEISDASYVGKKELGRCYRFLRKELEYDVAPQMPGQFIPKFTSGNGYNEDMQKINAKAEEISYKILSAAKKLKLTSGRGPQGLAAAAGYIGTKLAGGKKTQIEFAKIYQVTEVTIRNRYSEMIERLMFEMTL